MEEIAFDLGSHIDRNRLEERYFSWKEKHGEQKHRSTEPGNARAAYGE